MKKKIILLSFLALVISLFASYYLNTIFKQTLIEAEQRKLTSTAYASSTNILSYFKTLEHAITTIGSSQNTILAMEKMSSSFHNISKERTLTKKEIEELIQYSKINFINKLDTTQKNNDSAYLPKELSGLIAQFTYIVNNPFDIGHKQKLTSSTSENLTYNKVHKKYHPLFLREQNNYGFYDMFLIDTKGTIVYSVDKEFDFGTNLNDGIYAKSNLGQVYKKAINLQKQQVIFEDFSPYIASFNKPASFLSFPIFKNNKIIGVLAVQIPIDKINQVMSLNNKRIEFGFGTSGEMYLVGEDKFMRSDSRFISTLNIPKVKKYQTTVGIVKVDTESVRDGLKGNSGSKLIKDYRNTNVFSTYLPLDIFDTKWILLAEIDEKEVVNLQRKNSITVFVVSISIIVFIIFGFIFIIYNYMIKPLEKHNVTLNDDIVKLDHQVLISQSILNEYKKAVDASSIVSKTNLNGKITYTNNQFCTISGYSQQELLGQSHNLIRHPDNQRAFFKELWSTIKSKKIWKGIIKNKRKDGTSYYVNSTIVPILDKNNNILEFMSIRSDVTDLINKEKLISKQTTDTTTGLPNRIKLMELIGQCEDEIKLAIIQVDELQSISDFYGLQYKDKLINKIAKSIQNFIDTENFQLFKIESDKFVILHTGEIPYKDFIEICETINKHFDHNSFSIENDNFDVTITIGIAKNKTNIYANAERALYHAYETHNNMICYDTSSDIQNDFEQNRKWVRKIKDAIHNDRIVVFAQPIVSLSNMHEKKFECLIRMIDTDGTIISPFYFLEIAKHSRLYTTLTKIVIDKSFKYFSTRDASFSINLTIEDIMNENILHYLREKIQEYKVSKKLVLEIVESEGIENFDEITNFIIEMKSYGCQISIDDFGTGYSNFEYLMKLDAQYIKIDGSLIKNIDHDESAQVVVALIVEFAKKLNRKTIAEYVHSKEVLDKVKEMKIDYSQGYFTGEPSLLQ